MIRVFPSKKVQKAGFGRGHISCYTLIGWPKDTKEKAEKRLQSVIKLGITPFAMLWRNDKGVVRLDWKSFQREWASPIIVGSKFKIGK